MNQIDNNSSVIVRFTNVSIQDCLTYQISEDVLSAFLAINPNSGKQQEGAPYLLSLDWVGKARTGQSVPLKVWYCHIPGEARIEVLAITHPDDVVTNDANNTKEANRLSRWLIRRIRDVYIGYRVMRDITDHWDDFAGLLF